MNYKIGFISNMSGYKEWMRLYFIKIRLVKHSWTLHYYISSKIIAQCGMIGEIKGDLLYTNA